jgi:hypothetical protein
MIIIDEIDRLNMPSLEALRNYHHRTGVGLILIGMPGIERRLARYHQLRTPRSHRTTSISVDSTSDNHAQGLRPPAPLHHNRTADLRRRRHWSPTHRKTVASATCSHGNQLIEHHHRRGRRFDTASESGDRRPVAPLPLKILRHQALAIKP